MEEKLSRDERRDPIDLETIIAIRRDRVTIFRFFFLFRNSSSSMTRKLTVILLLFSLLSSNSKKFLLIFLVRLAFSHW